MQRRLSAGTWVREAEATFRAVDHPRTSRVRVRIAGRIGRQIRGARRVVGRVVARPDQRFSVKDQCRHPGQGPPRRCVGRRSRHASPSARIRRRRGRWAARGVGGNHPARRRRRWRHLDRRQRPPHPPRHHHRTRRRATPLPASSWGTRGPTTLRRTAVRCQIRGRTHHDRTVRRTRHHRVDGQHRGPRVPARLRVSRRATHRRDRRLCVPPRRQDLPTRPDQTQRPPRRRLPDVELHLGRHHPTPRRHGPPGSRRPRRSGCLAVAPGPRQLPVAQTRGFRTSGQPQPLLPAA